MEKSFGREVLSIVMVSLATIAVDTVLLVGYGVWHDEWSGYNANLSLSDGWCNVAIVPLAGDIMPYHNEGEYRSVTPDDVRAILSQVEYEPYIEGILVRINSGGGAPAASAQIAAYLKNSTLPVVALIGDYGTSGAYLVATAADTIIASPYADIGSIGVTMSYVDNVSQNTDLGLEYVSLTSAQFKDYGSPDKPLTADERALIERDLAIYHQQFVNDVALNRALDTATVAALADGSSLPSTLALEARLIDDIGDDETARAWFAEKLERPAADIIYCE